MGNLFAITETEKNRIRLLHELINTNVSKDINLDECGDDDMISIELGDSDDEGTEDMGDMEVMVIDNPEEEEVMTIDDRISAIELHLAAIKSEQGGLEGEVEF